MTLNEIKKYIDNHAAEYARRKKLFDYYNGKHEILNRAADAGKPNNRIVNGFGTVISNTFCGYMFGEPIEYSGDEKLLEHIGGIYEYTDEQAENNAIGLDASICGVAYEVMYIDDDGFIRFTRVDPCGCIVITDNTIEERITDFIRYYDVYDVLNSRTSRFVEHYDAESKTVYKDNKVVETYQHGFKDVPVIEYKNTSFKRGDFEGVVTLIDAYDSLQSDSVNNQDYFNDAYLMLKGLDGTTADDVAAMREARVLILPDNADAAWLLKSESDTLTENLKTRIRSDIFKLSGCPDMSDENFAANASGVAIRYKLMGFEDISAGKEREFKRGLQRRIELICNMLETLGRGHFDWRTITINFKRALPESLQESAQALSTIGALLSDETKRAMLPFDVDEETEKERLAEQTAANMSLFIGGHESDELNA